jgi:serine/threonine-protein kinase
MPENKDKQILFERFRIEDCLKKDPVTSVFIAWHIHLDKKILLKTLNASEIEDHQWLERFRREAKVLARLDHPNIIRILDFGSENNIYYISSEFFDGRNLRQVFQSGTLSPEQKHSVLIQLLQGLAAAHRNGIIHRDVKPENILVNDAFQVKLADFGLAFPAEESKITRQSSLVGTPAYMSPEQIRGENLNEKTDLFSSGIVALEMFRGFHPFLGGDVKTTINNILSFNHGTITARLSTADPPVIAEMLQPSPDRRPASASAVLEKLGIKPEEIYKITTPKKNYRRKILYSTILIVMLCLIGAGSYMLYPDPEQSLSEEAKVTLADPDDVSDTFNRSQTPPDQLKEFQKPEVTQEIMKMDEQAMSENNTLKSGNLFIFSDPASDVYLDQMYRGRTPFQTPIILAAGKHWLKLTHARFPDYLEEIDIEPGQLRLISYQLDTLYGYLSCQIYPWGLVLIDGRLIGETPLPEPVPLTAGSHTITIEHPGFQGVNDTLTIARQETVFYRINLEKRAGQP